MTARPPCPRCGSPAFPTEDGWGYCKGNYCGSRYRICSSCQERFDRAAPGSGTRYCSTCKDLAKNPERLVYCSWCEGPGERNHHVTNNKWPYICRDCLEPISHIADRLKKHNVNHEMAHGLVLSPLCQVCGIDIVSKQMNKDGQIRSPLVVDHDHACCPGISKSCGQCVRGFLCGNCNSAVGLIRNDPLVAENMARYLKDWGNGRTH